MTWLAVVIALVCAVGFSILLAAVRFAPLIDETPRKGAKKCVACGYYLMPGCPFCKECE